MPSERKLDVAAINSLVIAGWTGRNVAALEAHIKELEAIGVKRPKTVPIFYRVACSLLTTATFIEVMADKSSGEVEFVLFALDDGLWLGVGSDHTDRKAETVGVTLSKQLCAKPVGRRSGATTRSSRTGTSSSCARSCRTAASAGSIRKARSPTCGRRRS